MTDIDYLEKQAVDAVINFDWQKAIEINESIIKIDKKNAQTYLRLGFIYLQLNKIKKSKEYYQKAINLQPGNQIAKQNLERLKVLEKKSKNKTSKRIINLDPNLFLELPGKTKSVALVNLGQKDVLASVSIGQEVALIKKKRRIEVRTKNHEYIGCLPDDLSKRLILFLQNQGSYDAFIKESNLNKIIVFIKEVKKGKRVQRFISFPYNLHANIDRISTPSKKTTDNTEGLEKETVDEVEEPEAELEKLAENLTEEEKLYLPYGPSDETEEDDEEE